MATKALRHRVLLSLLLLWLRTRKWLQKKKENETFGVIDIFKEIFSISFATRTATRAHACAFFVFCLLSFEQPRKKKLLSKSTAASNTLFKCSDAEEFFNCLEDKADVNNFLVLMCCFCFHWRRKHKRKDKKRKSFGPCACAYACVEAVFTVK